MIDGRFLTYELILLFLFYGIYCLLLKFNGRINQFFKDKCCSKESSKSGEIPMDDNNPANPESFSNEVVRNFEQPTEYAIAWLTRSNNQF